MGSLSCNLWPSKIALCRFTRNHLVNLPSRGAGSMPLRPMRSHPTRQTRFLLIIATPVRPASNRGHSRVIAPGLLHRYTSNSGSRTCFAENLALGCAVAQYQGSLTDGMVWSKNFALMLALLNGIAARHSFEHQSVPGAIHCEPRRVPRVGEVKHWRDLCLVRFSFVSDGRQTMRRFLSTY